MAALPYIQLYVADYLADTAHLSTVEHGAYLLLIMNYWQRGESFRANDERTLSERLARVARMRSDEFETIKPTLAEFFETDETEWRHDRIERDLEAVFAKSTKARASARTSAERRLSKRPANDKRTLSERSANAQRTPSHTDTDTDTDKRKEGSASAAESDPVWGDGLAYLLERSSCKESTLRALLGRLVKTYGRDRVDVAITDTIANEPADPKSYLIAILKKPTVPRKKSDDQGDPVCTTQEAWERRINGESN